MMFSQHSSKAFKEWSKHISRGEKTQTGRGNQFFKEYQINTPTLLQQKMAELASSKVIPVGIKSDSFMIPSKTISAEEFEKLYLQTPSCVDDVVATTPSLWNDNVPSVDHYTTASKLAEKAAASMDVGYRDAIANALATRMSDSMHTQVTAAMQDAVVTGRGVYEHSTSRDPMSNSQPVGDRWRRTPERHVVVDDEIIKYTMVSNPELPYVTVIVAFPDGTMQSFMRPHGSWHMAAEYRDDAVREYVQGCIADTSGIVEVTALIY